MVIGATHAGAFRVAALNHKSRNHAVKDRAVIKTLLYQGQKIAHGIRCNLRVELYFNNALGGFDRYNRIHLKFLQLLCYLFIINRKSRFSKEIRDFTEKLV